LQNESRVESPLAVDVEDGHLPGDRIPTLEVARALHVDQREQDLLQGGRTDHLLNEGREPATEELHLHCGTFLDRVRVATCMCGNSSETRAPLSAPMKSS
jgi:hypothetical protein